MRTYPICLIGLEDCVVLVIGGGGVATRKVKSLVEAGAMVTVISPEFDQGLRDLAESGKIHLVQRAYHSGDLLSMDSPSKRPALVIAATDVPEINQAVWQEARQIGCLVNVVDDPEHSNFIVPAMVGYGELKISISTGGASPALARRLREKLADVIGPEYGVLAELMAELRPDLRARFEAGEPRLQAALQLVDSNALDIIRTQGSQAGRLYLARFLERLDAEKKE